MHKHGPESQNLTKYLGFPECGCYGSEPAIKNVNKARIANHGNEKVMYDTKV
jgi:hypothetical protein